MRERRYATVCAIPPEWRFASARECARPSSRCAAPTATCQPFVELSAPMALVRPSLLPAAAAPLWLRGVPLSSRSGTQKASTTLASWCATMQPSAAASSGVAERARFGCDTFTEWRTPSAYAPLPPSKQSRTCSSCFSPHALHTSEGTSSDGSIKRSRNSSDGPRCTSTLFSPKTASATWRSPHTPVSEGSRLQICVKPKEASESAFESASEASESCRLTNEALTRSRLCRGSSHMEQRSFPSSASSSCW
mmetsp:Transcript_2054/g.5359  ORF Transcript_2054/g.5359 Transcript_2054/m.5359 type:complete len:250 (-) Transcript_2054:95-844(-)